MNKNKEPICPKCSIEGVGYIVSVESDEQSNSSEAWFDIVHCSNCGHIYGVFNKIILRPVVEQAHQKKKK